MPISFLNGANETLTNKLRGIETACNETYIGHAKSGTWTFLSLLELNMQFCFNISSLPLINLTPVGVRPFQAKSHFET